MRTAWDIIAERERSDVEAVTHDLDSLGLLIAKSRMNAMMTLLAKVGKDNPELVYIIANRIPADLVYEIARSLK